LLIAANWKICRDNLQWYNVHAKYRENRADWFNNETEAYQPKDRQHAWVTSKTYFFPLKEGKLFESGFSREELEAFK
jgi:hypothetical protein